MCAQNQELDGMCNSPHDFPAKWAAMIFGYFDESGEVGDGYYVVAGFIGRRRDWKKFIPLWKEALGDRSSLHMAELRLGSNSAQRRCGDVLKALGEVPRTVGLKAFSGSVRTSDFSQRTNGTIAEIIMKGYPLALCGMLEAVMQSNIPRHDRIEFTFEEQVEFAKVRAQAFSYWRTIPEYKSHHGRSRIAKDASIEKGSVLLEPADYLSYALLQKLIDPQSQKALLTSPILDGDGYGSGRHLTAEQANYLLDTFEQQSGGQLTPMHPDAKKYLNSRLRNELHPVTAPSGSPNQA